MMQHLLYAPDPTFTGSCYGIDFCDGVGLCDNDFLAGFLCAKGFTTIPEECAEVGGTAAENATVRNIPEIPDNLDGMRLDELVTLARSLGVSLAGIPQGNREKLVAAIRSFPIKCRATA